MVVFVSGELCKVPDAAAKIRSGPVWMVGWASNLWMVAAIEYSIPASSRPKSQVYLHGYDSYVPPGVATD